MFADAQEIAERSGKNCLVAITDHNTVLGVIEARKILATGKYPNVELISGAEFTVDMSVLNGLFGGKRVFGNCHILAYGFDENNPALIEFSKKYHEGKRPNITFRELVDLMKKTGGKLVIAHPGLIKIHQNGLKGYNGPNVELQRQLYDIAEKAESNRTLLKFIPNSKVILELIIDRLLKLSGGTLVGMERFHPDNYSHGFDKAIGEICQREGLIQTAGSDFHGYNLHTEFSVGNPFTENFQEFYKELLSDCTMYRCGIHVSHLPGIGLLRGENVSEEELNSEIEYISGNGEIITQEQYDQVTTYFGEHLRKINLENNTSRYPKPKKKKSNNNKGKDSNNQNNNHHHRERNHGRKGKKGKFYYPSEDRYDFES